MEFEDKTYIITGGTSGMGKGIAMHLGLQGASLVINGRDAEKGKKVCDELKSKGIKISFLAGDVSAEVTNKKLVDLAIDTYGKLDGVVLSAGILGLGKVTELDSEIWSKTIGTNLDAIYYLTKYSIPKMLENGKGNVVVIASITSEKVFPSHAAYCASKAGAVALTKQIALEYGPVIRANAICPGPVDTPLLWDSAKGFPNPKTAVEDAKKTTAVKELGTPEDIAELAAYLLSEKSKWVTGSAITIDGGRMLY